ncbi:MAG: HEAT repeat domain-containing protein [Bryobacteraceae bacterium]|nr:HEAT repeat domain-containing protein [Bryobacteraceae bacterium]MDW8377404.1 HEAT repeat domain-containing protein [Bryobacterales bacterium]
MNCETARQDFALYFYGELDFAQEEALEQHLGACADCRQQLEREKALFRALDDAERAAPADLLHACRRELHFRLQAQAPAGGKPQWLAGLRAWKVDFFSAYAWRAAAALALLVAGFLTGRYWDSSLAASRPAVTRVRGLSAGEEGLRLVVEEVRQRTIRGRLEEDHIRRLVLAAAADPSDPVLRARSLEVLKDRCDRVEVRRALLQALKSDENASVRLLAIEALRPFAADPETRQVLSQILLTDQDPALRMRAIDLLVQHMNTEAIGLLQELIIRDEHPDIRSKSVKALREINASVETF